ncbi:protein kinase domain-containing protein [Streptomyces sp. NRRL F-2664]|uniref:protein kinase domain-containing protein n=1 Tax=Streptomyces sp. NRRL F-2664 TaxID=1463842 RepID=UPI00068970B5|nr:protein kinase [Streptomyces sp. NRRL F-2664]
MEPLREDDPETIGPYRLFALLGRGGWGNVYFARSEFGRGVALKTIRPEHLAGAPERFRRRFAREVEAARAVDSTYTAQVVDADTHAAAPWLAARYIRGVDLAEALDHCRAPLPQRTWRVLATGLADALRSIHAADLVHRDLKLANILLAADGPYVIDFGIARNLSPVDGVTLTGSGAAPRTVTFASPEQLRDERVGPASDVFALGVVLAYAALNRHPFGPGSAAQIQANILHGRHRLDGLPDGLAKIVLSCLDPRPQDRPTPLELARLLPPGVSPKEHEWLPPGLRGALAGLSDLAVDLEAPMRHRPARHEPPALPGPGRPPAATTPAPAVRAVRERELPPTPPRASVHEATTRPPTGAGPSARQVGPPESPEAPPDPPVAPTGKATGRKAYKGEPGARHRAAAEAGNSEAMRQVAVSCRSVRDWRQALSWFARAAEAGNPTGAREAAQLIEQHLPELRGQVGSFYRRAAEGGDLHSAMRLGALLEQQPGGLAEALTWYERAAGRDHEKAPEAVARVRGLLARAAAAEVKGAQGAKASKGATAAGAGRATTAAQAATGTKVAQVAEPVDAVDAAEAVDAVQDADAAPMRDHAAAACGGRVESMMELAGWHLRAKRVQEALTWYRRAAEAGHVHAMVVCAQLLAADPEKHAESLDWYRRAAAEGNTDAMHCVGRSLKQCGALADALTHFRVAASKGHRAAMVDAAEILEQTGRTPEALKWYMRASDQGHAQATLAAERLRAQSTGARTTGPAGTAGSTAPKQAAVVPARKQAAAQPAPKKGAAPPVLRQAAAESVPKKAAAVSGGKGVAAGRTTPRSAAAKPEASADADSLRAEAVRYERSNRPEAALQCLLRAERLGDRTVGKDIIRLHLAVRGRSNNSTARRQHLEQVVRRYRDLAEDGDIEAMFALVGLDTPNAFAWWQRAAEAGSTRAMRRLARAQLKAGSDEHVAAALSWLLAAGEAGDTAAILEGARVHEQRGAYGNAIDWYRWAEESGVAGAARERARVTAEHPGAVVWHRWSERLRRLRG